MSTNAIVVGYDASESAEAALGWALDESTHTGTPVTLVYAYEWRQIIGSVGMVAPAWPDESMREAAQEVVAAALARVRRSHPGLVITGEVTGGVAGVGAAPVLVEKSRRARLIVVGHHGHGGFAELLVGSTGVAVSAHAHCPVVVVRGEKPPTGAPVVVGFDSSDCALLAVEFAFAEAARHGTGLQLIQAWTPPAPRWQPAGYDLRQRIDAERAELAEAVASWRDKYPEVPASVQVIAGPAAEALVEASQGARLVVVGSRGRGGFRGLLLGSVSQQLLHHAHCPVAVVRKLPD